MFYADIVSIINKSALYFQHRFEMSSTFSDRDKFFHGFHLWRFELCKYKVTYFYYLCTSYFFVKFGDGQL